MAKKRRIEGPALLWKRFVAFVIDLLLIFAIAYLVFADALNSALASGNFSSPVVNYFSTVWTLLVFIYFINLEKRTGQSVGKIIMKIHVKSDGDVKWWHHWARSLFVIIPVLSIVDPAFLLLGKNQRLGEMLSKSRVVAYY